MAMISFDKLTRAETITLGLLGFGLGLMPHALGFLLGFAAFVVTPVVGGLAAIACGFAAVRATPQAVWNAALIVCLVAGATFAGISCAIVAVLAFINHDLKQLAGVPLVAAGSAIPVLGGSALVYLGALIGQRRRAT